MSRLDVLFVIPVNLGQVYQAHAKGHAIEPPAKARFVASYLMRRNVSVDLLDAPVVGMGPREMAIAVGAMNPRLVVLPVYGYNPSSSTHTMPAAREFAGAIKETSPEIPIIMMGTHPTALPEKTLQEEPVDYVCGGEGPITIHELLLVLKAGRRMEDIRKVRSLWYWDDGRVAKNAPAPLIDLNEEPAIDGWKLMDPRKYYAHDWHTFYRDFEDRGPYANPYSREGCPFHCSFCNIQAPYREGEEAANLSKNSFRDLRPELFLEELTFLVETYGVKYVKVPDEMFGLGEHPIRIATLIKERFGDSLNIWCYFRIDTCKPKHLELLRSAGFRWLGLGIEAANSTVRSGQDKKFTDDHIYAVVERLHAAGIEGGLNYIFGLPGDTMESMQETLKLAVSLNSVFANFYCNQALPGSAQYREAKLAGYPLPERPGGPGWIGHSQYSRESEPFYMGGALTPAQILAYRDYAHMHYFTRPEYIRRIMNDPKLGETAMRNIGEWIMNIRSLKRDLFGGRTVHELTDGEKEGLVPKAFRLNL